MGHIVNPTRYRLGKSIYWSNNWPAEEKKRYIDFYGFLQELDQYFQSLFFYSRSLRLVRRRRKKVFSRNRRPNIYYSHINYNIYGFKLDKLVLDVNIFDYFLEGQIDDFLSPTNDNYAKFIKKFKAYFSLDFFLRHQRAFLKITKARFHALLYYRRKSYTFIEKIFREKIKKFFNFYCHLIKRTYFSFLNDKQTFLNRKYLQGAELRLLRVLSFRYRESTLLKYWIKKYKQIKENPVLDLNEYFENYFTSDFAPYIEKRGTRTPKPIYLKKRQLKFNKINFINTIIKNQPQINEKFKSLLDEYHNEINDIEVNELDDSDFVKFVFKKYSNKPRNTFIDKLYNIVKYKYEIEDDFINQIKNWIELDSEDNFDIALNQGFEEKKKKQQQAENNEISEIVGKLKYMRLYQEQQQYQRKNKKNKVTVTHLANPTLNQEIELENKINLITALDTKQFRDDFENYDKLLTVVLQALSKYKKLNEFFKKEFLFLEPQYKNLNLVFKNICDNLMQITTKNANDAVIGEKKNIIEKIEHKRKALLNNTLLFQSNMNLKIQKLLDKSKNLNMKYDLDPFYQSYMKLRNLKSLILNINVGLGEPEDHLDARFLSQYVKKLFRRKKPLWEIYRTMFRTLQGLDYLDGFLIVFAGRFTRNQYATYQLKKKGFLSFGNTNKLIDYQTSGFAGKFGYCGIKVYLQYKSNFTHYKEFTLQVQTAQQEQHENTTFFNFTRDKKTNQKIIKKNLNYKEPSKKLKRILQETITKNNGSFYNNDDYLLNTRKAVTRNS